METSRGDSKSRAFTPLAPCPHGAACNTLRARLTTGRAFNVFQLIMFPPLVMDNSGSIDSAILAFNRKLTRVLSSNSITIALKSSSFANRTCLTVLPFKVGYSTPSALARTVLFLRYPSFSGIEAASPSVPEIFWRTHIIGVGRHVQRSTESP